MKTSLRKKVANKARKLVAQEEKPAVPKITDEGPEGGPGSAVPTPPAPPMKGKEEVEEEVEQDIKKEKEEEVKVDSMEDNIKKITETLETVVEALSDQKKIIEKALLGDTELEEKFEEVKEEDEEDAVDEFSAEEFGVSPENLIVSNEEDKMSLKSLRTERKARLYKGVEKAKEAATLSEEFEEEKAKRKTFKPSAPAPTITKVKKSEIPEMLKLAELAFELNKDKTKWSVGKVGEDGKEFPLYEIENTKDSPENFATEDFIKEMIKDMKTDGIEATLDKHDAKKVEAESDVVISQEKENIPEKPVEKIEKQEEQKKLQDYKRQFNRAFRLALTAMRKNLVNNPLKGAFYETLTGIGMEDGDARTVIEAAFARGADEHFETALAETEKYLNMSDEAFVDYEAVIDDVETAQLSTDEVALAGKPSEKAVAMRKRAAKASLPFSTASQSDPTSFVEALNGALPKPKLIGLKDIPVR